MSEKCSKQGTLSLSASFIIIIIIIITTTTTIIIIYQSIYYLVYQKLEKFLQSRILKLCNCIIFTIKKVVSLSGIKPFSSMISECLCFYSQRLYSCNPTPPPPTSPPKQKKQHKKKIPTSSHPQTSPLSSKLNPNQKFFFTFL